MGDNTAKFRVSAHRFPSRLYRWLNRRGRQGEAFPLGSPEGMTFEETFLPFEHFVIKTNKHASYDTVYSRRKKRKRFLNPFYSKIMSEIDEA